MGWGWADILGSLPRGRQSTKHPRVELFVYDWWGFPTCCRVQGSLKDGIRFDGFKSHANLWGILRDFPSRKVPLGWWLSWTDPWSVGRGSWVIEEPTYSPEISRIDTKHCHFVKGVTFSFRPIILRVTPVESAKTLASWVWPLVPPCQFHHWDLVGAVFTVCATSISGV